MSNRDGFDICVVGAGVIGLATAFELAKKYESQNVSILLLEREASFGQHTSSRNSEVIHAGIYYPSGSLKARFCVTGKEMLYEHCARFDLPHRRVGKLIVGNEDEVHALERLNGIAIENGVGDLQFLDATELRKLEPAVAADAALLSPSTGIIDSHSFMQSLLHLAQNLGVQFSPFTYVEQISDRSQRFVVHCRIDANREPEHYQFECRHLINAAGLDAQSLACKIEAVAAQSIPPLYYCKGDYFDYRLRNPFNHLIYPVPEADAAGLGIHATMDLSGQLKFGPDTEYIDHMHYAIDARKAAHFAAKISSYFPGIKLDDLRPAYSGIRPKLVPAGAAPTDFMIQLSQDHGVHGLIQLFGMESPALTSSLAIGRYVAERVEL